MSMSISMIMYMYILKYNLLSPYNINCMHMFKADLLALDNQLVCSSMVKAISPTPNFPQLPVLLFVVLRLEFCLPGPSSGLRQVTMAAEIMSTTACQRPGNSILQYYFPFSDLKFILPPLP